MTPPNSSEPAPTLLLSVDPGKTNGVSIFRDGKVESMCQVRLDDFPQFLGEFAEKSWGLQVVVVYENYKLFKGRALQQTGSTMEASQAIGQLKMIAAQQKWKIHDQPPSIKKIAQMWSGHKPTGNHAKSHDIDAYNHGVYWLVSNGMRRIETDG